MTAKEYLNRIENKRLNEGLLYNKKELTEFAERYHQQKHKDFDSLLYKLLHQNMCSHLGDELIEDYFNL